MRGLHEGQVQVARSSARFRVLAAGRRWGKTRLGVFMLFIEALQGGRTWWIAPTYSIGRIAWRQIRLYARALGDAEVREAEKMVKFPGGGWIQLKSADNPDSLRGEGLDYAVLDEAAFMSETAWAEAIRPALADRVGGALFCSTPNGRNWFWRLWQNADCRLPNAECENQNANSKIGNLHSAFGNLSWAAWQFPTASNPFIAKSEIEAARRNLPERVFRQEFLAEFIEDGGGVLRRVVEAATAAPQDRAVNGHDYVLGVDWGKHEDFTVICVIDLTESALVAMDRFNQIDYALQIQRLKALCERFNPRVVIAESNSMGEPLIEQLSRAGLPVQPFQTTAASKAQAIDALALAFERGELKILPDPTLIAELQAYQAERLPSGLLRYGAPEGMHDDCVMALALAWQACTTPIPSISRL